MVEQNAYKNLIRKPNDRVHLRDLDLDERTLFNWASGRYDVKIQSALN